MVNPSTDKKHYPVLDGIRGLAILLVVFHHNFRFLNYFFFGWLGVDLFFVLSGFLITDILLHTVDKPNYLRNFYGRRLLRIFPLFYLALILCLLVLPQMNFFELDIRYYTENQGWLWSYLQNWLFIFREPYGDPILLHTWSLAVEEQFYLFWPLLILLIRKPKRLLILIISLLLIVVIARYVVWAMHFKSLAYASLFTFTRIDGLCIGSMIAVLMRINPNFLKKYIFFIILFIAAVNFGFYFVNHSNEFALPYLGFAGYTTFAVLFGYLVYDGVRGPSPIINFIFNNRLLRFLGKISYGLYVYHWPIYLLIFPGLQSLLQQKFHLQERVA